MIAGPLVYHCSIMEDLLLELLANCLYNVVFPTMDWPMLFYLHTALGISMDQTFHLTLQKVITYDFISN